MRVSDEFMIQNVAVMNCKWEIVDATRRLVCIITCTLCTSSIRYSLFLIIIIIISDVILRMGNVEGRSETRRTRKLIRFKIMIMKTSWHDGCHRTRLYCGHTTDVSGDNTPRQPISTTIQKRFHPK
jgi:hypothetical protein